MDGLIQTLGNVARVKKSAQNHSPSARVSRAFLNSRNIPACLDQAIQTKIRYYKDEIVYLAWVGGSCVVRRGLWVVRRGSWVVRQKFAKKIKTELYHELPKFCTNLFSYATSLLTMATLTKMLVDSLNLWVVEFNYSNLTC